MPIPAMIEEHLRLPVIGALVEKMSREYGASRAQINHSAFAG